ncbi:choice-of-anchor G family protein [Microbacterium sp. GCS4]|uniref:choice-of-anchor G family protein n=1 Tax=Microbacterium sp. GCS4 TaxID=1692239 RepID=UPI00067FF8FD|nr:choice-of-anchor G family protein [Microbacterium sp. GCS4]
MAKFGGAGLRRRRAAGAGLAGAIAAAVVLAGALVPTAATAAPGDQSASSSRFLSGSLLLGGVPLDDVVALGGSSTSNAGSPTPDTETSSLDLTALNALQLGIPGGLSVPLSNFVQLGAVNQYSQSSDAGVSRAAAGAVSDSGVIDTTGTGAYPSNASFNLQGLLGSAVTGTVADLDISLEAISSEVAIDSAGAVTRDYNVAGGDVALSLPAIATLTNTLTGPGGVTATVDAAVASLAGPSGLLAQALAGLNAALAPIVGNDGVNITITTDIAAAMNTILDTPVGDGVVSVNLRTGLVTADIAALFSDTTGRGLNNLNVGEEVLSAAVLNNLITRVGNVLNTVPNLVQTALTNTLNAAVLNIGVAVCVVGTAPTCTTPVVDIGTGLQVSVPNQTLGSVVAGTATATISLKVAGLPVVVPVGTLLGALTTPINTTLFGPTGVIATVVPTVTTAVTGIVTAIAPAVGLLNGVVSLRGNVQPDNGPIFSEEAFVLTVGDILGTGGVGTIALARAQAGPNALADAPTVDAAATVQAGDDLAVTGAGWPANTEVSVQLTAPGGGANVGGPETVTTDGTGGFTLAYPVPAGTPAATGYTVTATDGTSTAFDTTDVTAAPATVDAAPAVQAGADLAVTGAGWPANTEVSVQMTAPGGGANVGGPETVTTDGTGGFTLAYPVPAGTPAATGYTVTATAGAVTATDTTEVTDAPVPTVDAAPTVQAGTDLAVSGTNWPANTEVSLQLTAPGGGANVGGPETVTTDGTGAFTLAYPVPASAAAGTGYTVTATAGAQTAIDTTDVTAAATVDADDTVQAGSDLGITGANWPANTEVTVQLTAPGGGANVGGPETVTTDGTGGFTLAYPVPAGTPAGTGYTVTATVGAQTATDTTAVTAAPTVDAADTVEAGSSLSVTGSDWPADTEVTVQLTAPGGAPIGTPQTTTTSGLGGFTLAYPVPAGTPAGTGYTVTATAGAATAVDTTEVTAAPVVLDAAASVPAGTNLAVTGSGWPVNATVSLQLTAPGGGANVGGPVSATTDAFGAFSVNYPVPADTAPATGYTLTGTSGAVTQTDTVEVTAGDPADVNTNAAASASASADATADGDPSAQAAAEAAALADATSAASAAATADASAAAVSAATTDASTTATTDATAAANASAAVAAQAAAQADASDDANAAASTAADANSAASSESAATADSSTNASSEASTNANAAASASASANADASTDAVAEAAAQAAAWADATAEGSAAANPAAEAAAQTAATATSSTDATADATSAANAGAAVAAQAAALADATSTTAAQASATSDASTSAASNASAAALASASTDASSDAVASADADADPSAEVNTNASASAAASAQADSDANAVAEAAAVAAALADATSSASAAADVTADAAASAAATTDASTDASSTATTDANASAAAAAQAAAQTDATSTSAADASAAATANANASSAAAANASASATASSSAAADVSADATAEASATATSTASASASADGNAAANPGAQIGIRVVTPVLERGDQQTAIGTGFQPGETVTGLMTSAPLALGSRIANAQGEVTFTWTIPADTDLGTHTVTLTGATSGAVSTTFQVVASGLATTGGDVQTGWVALAALLLLMGLGAVRLGRRRAQTVAADRMVE